MSCGSPAGGGGSMRQRHSQGDVSGSDDADLVLDLEDDASSCPPRSPPMLRRPRTWGEILASVVWVAFAAFIIYYGDRHSNLVGILWSDGRIKRMPLYIGLVGVVVNVGLILYTTIFSWGPQKSNEKYEALLCTAPSMIVLGFLSFCLISFALWPIWGFLTILLLITLFMSSMVILSYLGLRLRPMAIISPHQQCLEVKQNFESV